MRRQVIVGVVQFDRQLRDGSIGVADAAPVAARLGAAGVEDWGVSWRDKPRELPLVRDQVGQLGLQATYATSATPYSRKPAGRAALLRDLDDAEALGSSILRVFRGELPAPGDAAARPVDPTHPGLEAPLR